jgi:hypothetical protein
MGIGFGCAPTLPDALYTPDLLDFVEITPEIFHRETIENGRRTLVPDRSFDAARRRCLSLGKIGRAVRLLQI